MPAIFGRAPELERLDHLFKTAHVRGKALVVVGDAGIGKSTLLRAAVERANDTGFCVLTTTGVEAETDLPYAGLHEVLRPVHYATSGLPEAQRAALSTAFGIEMGTTPEPFFVALAALNLLADVAAAQPVLVAVDDVQWLDGPSHDALAFIARRVSNDPIVVIGTFRSGFSGPYLDAGLEELAVRPLDDDAARAVLDQTGSDLAPVEREQVLHAALGNPLALVELPAAFDTGVGASEDVIPLTARLERAFAGRVAQLPQQTRDAILVAAVDPLGELPEILAAASVLAGTDVTADALEIAVAWELLRFDEMRLEFRHPLVRSAVVRAEPTTRRQAAHAALSDVLSGDPYRCTWHRAHAITGPDDAVADDLEHNHRTALQRGSVLSAIWSLERSAQLTTDPSRRSRRLLLAAEYASGLGRREKVDQLVGLACQLPLTSLDIAKKELLVEDFEGGAPADAGRVFELCAIAEHAIAAGEDELSLKLLIGAGLRCWWADPGASARARIVEVSNQRQERIGDPRYIATIAFAEPVSRAASVLAALRDIDVDSVDDPESLRLFGMAAHAVGDPVLAVDFLRRSEARLRAEGRLGLLSHVLNMQIADQLELGNWDTADSCAAEAARLAQETGQVLWDFGTMSLAAANAALRGDFERAHQLADEVERFARSRRLNVLLATAQISRCFAWQTAGKYSEAFEGVCRAFDPADPSFDSVERFHAVRCLADAALRTGRVDEACVIVADLEQVATVTPSPTLHIQLSYARAVLADDADAETHFHGALAQDLVRWPFARARLELAYGSWLRRRRRLAESRSPLRAAYTTFSAIGATNWADRTRAELRAAGERATASVAVAHQVLSPQEMQIARLAADGLSNREIGERLFMSHRTVGSHLYHIFPKLDITSRAQLTARLQLA
jgi:DNA-binding CsgD family transcriptional regulator